VSNNLEECAICFYPILTDKYVTDCSHTFHHTCIQEWSLHRSICPLCNFIIKIPELNIEITPDEETRIADITNSGLVDDLEFKRYQKRIKRQRSIILNNRTTQISPNNNNNTSIFIMGDYTALEGADDLQDMTRREFNRIHALIFCESINAVVLISYSVYLLQLFLIFLALITGIAYRKKIIGTRYSTLFLKFLYILYSVSTEQTEQLDYNCVFYFSCFLWITISFLK
jgi:hypothetical protein